MEMKTKIDSNMLGGVIVKVDDTLIDGSLKTQLEKLNSELKL
jgi:F0F1-type ATP synthase delta subunit